MSAFNRGVKNAFRNQVRTLSIVLILGLSIGLALVMLIAHQAVGQKINQVKSNVGNTINISPAGFNPQSQANNALTTTELAKVKSVNHVTGLSETLTDRLTTIGSSQPSFFDNSSNSNSNNQTSLTSPIKINVDSNRTGSGGGFFVSGGQGSLPSNFSPPITILGTNNPTQLNASVGNPVTIIKGTAISGDKDTNDVMVSNAMADKNSLKVGSTFTAYGQTLKVAAIYGISENGTQAGNDTVIVSLPALERLSGQGNVVSSAVATVDSADNLASATSAVKSNLGSSADVTNAQDEANNTIQPLKNVQSISLVSLIGALVAAAIIVLLTMIMIVRERRREIGILKAIGAPNLRVMLQFMSEALTLTVLAAAVGLIIGVAGGNPVTNTLVTNSTNSSTSSTATAGGPGGSRANFGGGGSGPVSSFRRPTGGFIGRTGGGVRNTLSNIHANIGWNILAYGLGAAVLVALIGSAAASWLISKVRPAEVLRSE